MAKFEKQLFNQKNFYFARYFFMQMQNIFILLMQSIGNLQ